MQCSMNSELKYLPNLFAKLIYMKEIPMKMSNFTTKLVIAVAIILPVSTPTFALANGINSAALYRCLQVADGDDNRLQTECIGAAMGECISKYSSASGKASCMSLERELWDNLLNFEYQQLLSLDFSDEFKIQLRNAQRAWMTVRDLDCGVYLTMGIGGSPGSQLSESCLLNHTATRAIVLTNLLKISKQIS